MRDGQEAALGQTITVILWTDDGNGNLQTQIDQVTTNSSYHFMDLNVAQSYQIQFVLPSGYLFTTQNVGSDDAIDSDVIATGYTGSIAVDGSANIDLGHIDAGLYVGGSGSNGCDVAYANWEYVGFGGTHAPVAGDSTGVRLADDEYTWIKQTVVFDAAVSGIALEGSAATNETASTNNGYNIRLSAPTGSDVTYQRADIGEGAFNLALNGDQMPTSQVEIIIFKDPNIEVDLTQLTFVGAECGSSSSTGGGDDEPSAENTMIEVANSSGVYNYPVGIFGNGFGNQIGAVTILGESAEILTWTDSFIRVRILNQTDGVGSLEVTTSDDEVDNWPFEVYSVDSAFTNSAGTFKNLFTGRVAILENLSSNVACFHVDDNATILASQFLTNYDCTAGYADFDLTNGAATISVDTDETFDANSDYYFQFFADGGWYEYQEFPDSPFAKTYEIQLSEDGNEPWVTVHSEGDNQRGSRLHKVTIPDDGNEYEWVRMRVTAATAGTTFRMLEVRFFEQTGSGDQTDTFALFGDSLTAAAFDNPDTKYGFAGNVKAGRNADNDIIFNVFGLVGASAYVNLVEDANSANDLYDALALDNNQAEMTYWGIGLGSNDAGFSADYGSRLEPAIIDLLALGRVPIIARMPDTAEALYRDGEFWGDIESKREILIAIDQLAAKYKLIPGPDLYTEFRLNIETAAASYYDNGTYQPDGVHHTTEGSRKLVELWSDTIVNIPSLNSPPPPPSNEPVIEVANISGVSGYEIGIFGSGFGHMTQTVTILDAPATILEWTNSFVRVVVPSGVNGLGDLRLTNATGAETTSEFNVYTIDSRWLDQPDTSYLNVSHGKPTTLGNVNSAASICYDVDDNSQLDASTYLTAYTCKDGIAAKFDADAAQGEVATITVDFEAPLLDGEYLFQFFSVASWSAGDGCSDQTGFPVAYTIRVSADNATWSAPLVTETANARGHRSHNLSLSGDIQYIQLAVTDTIGDCRGNDGINDFQMKEVRVYQVVGGNSPTEAIAMYGDSLAVGAFNSHVGATNLNARLDSFPSDIPFAPYGFIGRKAEGLMYDGFGRPDLLADVVAGDAIASNALYWGIALGTNDMNIGDEKAAGFSDPNSQFNQYDVHLRAAIEQLRDADRVPILARFPDTDENAEYGGFGFLAAKKILLNEIDRLNAEYRLIPGPDLYTEFRLNIERENDSWLSDFDGTHLVGEGHSAWIQLWADALSKGFTYRTP